MGLEKRRDIKTGRFSVKHGERHSRLYRVWEGMRRRCNDPKFPSYENYGGRGITVCEEWLNNASAFIQWAKNNGYKKGLSIDRIDVNGNYEPSNCRWVNAKQQANNRRNNVFITHNSRTQTIAEWENELGFKPGVIGKRLRKGICIKDAITKPLRRVI
jgi:hypothetical protein